MHVTQAALDAIAQARGARHPQPDEIKCCAIDPSGRVAWIEGEVARLRIAANGQEVFDRKLNLQDELNWGYEGCSVGYLQWWGDRLIAIAIEEHVTALWSVPVPGEAEYRHIPQIWCVAGELLLWASRDYPGLLCGLMLPSLRPLLPLPTRLTSPYLRLEAEDGQVVVSSLEGPKVTATERLTLPAAGQRSFPEDGAAFLALVERALFAGTASDSTGRMLLEAAAMPFWNATDFRVAPLWLPVYWYRHLVAGGQTAEAARHLAVLDVLAVPLAAKEKEQGWRPEQTFAEGAVVLAVRYVRRQARVQATACRTGELPPGWWCLLFEPAPGSTVPGSRMNPATLTPALRRAFEILVPTNPPSIPHRY